MIFEPGSISLPVFGRMISPCLPTAHSMNNPPARRRDRRWSLRRIAAVVLLQARERVMRDLAALTVDGRISMARTQRGSVSPVSTTGLYHASCALRRHRVRGRLHDQIGRAAELLAKFHTVARRATSSAAACLSDRLAARRASTHRTMVSICCVAQRTVVREVLNADGFVEVPRRHLPRSDARL